MEDEEIIRLYIRRDEKAVAETQRKYGGELQALAMRLLAVKEDAEECVNDTLLKAWNTIPPYIPAKLPAYLFRVCRSFACDRLDWRNAKKRHAEVISLTQELESCLPDPRPGEEEREGEITDAIRRFLSREESGSRILFVRRYWYAESIREIAEQTGMREGNVRVALYRIRKRLRSFLEEEGITL